MTPAPRRLGWIGRRALAGLVDVALAAGVSWLLWRLGGLSVGVWAPTDALPAFEALAVDVHDRPATWARRWFLLHAPLVFLVAGSGVATGTTPGTRIAGLEIVDRRGAPADPLAHFARGLAYLSWPATLWLAAAAPWVSRTQRGIPDLVARTWVVTRRARRPARTSAPRSET